jgi:hypothetical protein
LTTRSGGALCCQFPGIMRRRNFVFSIYNHGVEFPGIVRVFFCYLRIHVLTTQTLHIGLQQWNAHYPIHGICERGLSPNFSPVANPMYQPQLHKLLCITFCIMFIR